MKIKNLKLTEYNPRTIDERNLKNLMNSIKTFGWLSPIIINTYPGRENIVISVNKRIKAAIELGMDEVPTTEAKLDPATEMALNLAMNKIGGEFEDDRLIDIEQ